MALLPISSGRVNLAAGPVVPSDTYKDGLRYVGGAVRAGASTYANSSQGLPVDADGLLCAVDATGGLPTDAVRQNGFVISDSSLCTSTNVIFGYVNGIPVDINGAVCI